MRSRQCFSFVWLRQLLMSSITIMISRTITSIQLEIGNVRYLLDRFLNPSLSLRVACPTEPSLRRVQHLALFSHYEYLQTYLRTNPVTSVLYPATNFAIAPAAILPCPTRDAVATLIPLRAIEPKSDIRHRSTNLSLIQYPDNQ